MAQVRTSRRAYQWSLTTSVGPGLIREKLWYGEGGMHELRTVKEPKQSLATFEETVELLMRVRPLCVSRRLLHTDRIPQPENQHVKFNVDVKVQNDPDRLFRLMHDVIVQQPNWQTALAPRILLGLWHPSFLPVARKHLPYCRRAHIGNDLEMSRKFFWNHVDAFSVWFGALTTADGEQCVIVSLLTVRWTVLT